MFSVRIPCLLVVFSVLVILTISHEFQPVNQIQAGEVIRRNVLNSITDQVGLLHQKDSKFKGREMINHENHENKNGNNAKCTGKKGVCVFDIDSTLTHSFLHSDKEKCCAKGEGNECSKWDRGFGAFAKQAVQECLDKGNEVVILTRETNLLLYFTQWRKKFGELNPSLFTEEYVNNPKKFMFDHPSTSYSFSWTDKKNDGLNKILQNYGIEKSCLIFFDDDRGNGAAAEKAGFKWQVANSSGNGCGLTKNEFKAGLKLLRSTH
eukprot:Nk52_evm33s343 gene=Nk52_evmTU33s343